MTAVHLRLYVTGHTASAERARLALAALKDHMSRTYGLGTVISDIIDVLQDPENATRDGIFATPTTLRLSPKPWLRLFGDLSDGNELMIGLRLDPATFIEFAEPSR